MNGRFLLDTSIIIALFARESSVQERLERAKEVFVPSIVLGELYLGAHKSTRVEENLARVDEFAASSAVLMCNTETARRCGFLSLHCVSPLFLLFTLKDEQNLWQDKSHLSA